MQIPAINLNHHLDVECRENSNMQRGRANVQQLLVHKPPIVRSAMGVVSNDATTKKRGLEQTATSEGQLHSVIVTLDVELIVVYHDKLVS